METTENNKLIAKFLGLQEQNNPEERWFKQWFDDKRIINGQRNEILFFDKDWNWLMRVVEKIEKQAYIAIKGCSVRISTIIDVSAPTKIEAVYNAVVEFIQWYNKNNDNL